MVSHLSGLSPIDPQTAIVPHALVISPDGMVSEAIALMSSVRSCPVDLATSSAEIEEIYLVARSSCVIVVEHDRAIGILTQRDVVRLSAQQQPLDQISIRSVMTQPIMTLRASDCTDLFSALNLLQQHRIRHLPIVDDRDQVVGLITHESLRQATRPIDLLRLRLVGEVMTRTVICAAADCSLLEIVQRMADRRISSIVIVEPDANSTNSPPIPLGLITERDIVQLQNLQLDFQHLTADRVMSQLPVWMQPEDSLWDAHLRMEQLRVHHLIVVSQGKLAGIVTQTSILAVLDPIQVHRMIELLQQEVHQLRDERLTVLSQQATNLSQQLKSSEQRFQSIFNNTFQFTGLMTPEGILLEANETALTFGGITRAQVVNRPFWEAHWWTISPATQEQLRQAIARAALGEFIRYEVDVLGATEEVMTIDFSLRPLKDEHDRVVMLIPEGRDITAQKQVQRALELQVNLDRLLADLSSRLLGLSTTELSAALDAAVREMGEFLQVDSCHIFRYSADYETAQMTHEWVSSGFSPQKDHLQKLPRAAFPWSSDLLARGEILSVPDIQQLPPAADIDRQNWQQLGLKSLLLIPLIDHTQVIGSVGLTSMRTNQTWSEQNIHALRLFSEILTNALKRREAAAELQVSEGRYAALCSASPVGIFRVTPDGLGLYVNDRWCQLTGLESEAALGHGWLEAIYPDDRDLVMQEWQRTMREEIPYQQECRFIRPDGQVLWVLGQTVPEYDSQGQIVSYVGTLTDITELQQTQAELRRSYEDYNDLVDRIPVGVYKFCMKANGDEVFEYASRRWGEINQLDPVAVMKDPALAFRQIHPEDLDSFEHIKEQTRNTLDPFVWEGRMLIQGKVYWRHIESVATVRDNGDIVWDGIHYDITDMITAKQEQERLLQEAIASRTEANQARDLLNSVFNRMSDGIVALDTNWYYTYINEQAASILGRSAAELIGKHIWTEFPQDVGQPFYHAYYRAVAEQKVVYLEEYYAPWDRWFENRIYPDANGLTIYFTEITDRKMAEIAVEQSEQRYASLAAAAPVGIFRTDTAGNCIYVNERWGQIAGLTLEAALDRGWIKSLHPEDRDLVATEWERAIQENRPFTLEYRFQRLDGSISWVFGQAVAEYNAEGQITSYVGTITDISERKQAEAERLATQQLRTELKLLENILEVILAGYWDWDIPNHTEYLSPGFKRMFGYADHELANVPETWQNLIFPEDLPGVMACLEKHVQSGGEIPFYNEVRYRHRDGSTVWVICSGRVIEWDEASNPLRMIGCHINITERKQAELILHQTAAQLAASNRELEAFAYSVSHDLRAPLRAIDGFSKALLEEYGEAFDREGKEYFDRIRKNVSRMGMLIDDLLNLSRVSRATMRYTTVSLSTVAEEILIELQTSNPGRQVEWMIAHDIVVSADASLIRIVLTNLLDNAWKFTSHHPTARIEFGTIEIAGEPTYFIRDDGAGFDMAYAKMLFGVFQRLHHADEFPGTGIGLATVQRVIHRHGGRVWAEGVIEQGATFYFTLPQTQFKIGG